MGFSHTRTHRDSPAERNDQLHDALLSLVQAGTWSESQQIIAQHPELLEPRADALLGQWIVAQTDAETVQALQVIQTLLHRCKEIGVDATFGELADALASPGTANSGELQAILEELTRLAQTGTVAQRIELCRQALLLVSIDTQAELWAALQVELGNDLAQSPTGDRAENVEAAIAAYRQALEVYTRQAYPEQWASTQHNLGAAYHERIRGERAENVEAAIAAFQQALEVFTRQAFPERLGQGPEQPRQCLR